MKRSVEEGEAEFNAVSLEERGKFQEETLVNVGAVKRKGQFTPKGDRFQNEYLVVRQSKRVSSKVLRGIRSL